MLCLTIFHFVILSFMLSIIFHSVFTKSPANVCWIFTEGSLAFYFFYNVILVAVYHTNYKLAHEKDVDLMERTRKLFGIMMLVSPCVYIGLFTPRYYCSSDQTEFLKTMIGYQMLHILLEALVMTMYFFMYKRNVLKYELFSRPYDIQL